MAHRFGRIKGQVAPSTEHLMVKVFSLPPHVFPVLSIIARMSFLPYFSLLAFLNFPKCSFCQMIPLLHPLEHIHLSYGIYSSPAFLGIRYHTSHLRVHSPLLRVYLKKCAWTNHVGTTDTLTSRTLTALG